MKVKRGKTKVQPGVTQRWVSRSMPVALFFAAVLEQGVAGELAAGPFAQEYSLTLDTGMRREAVGPFLSSEWKGDQYFWGVSPLVSHTIDPSVDSEEWDVLYPIMTYDRFGSEYRFQWFQVFSFAGGSSQKDIPSHRFTLFPFVYTQRSPDTNLNYTAVLPFYGEMKHRLMRDRIKFVMFPLYVRSEKQDVATDNYLYPLFHLRKGQALRGWQVWPLVGHEQKGTTYKTNSVEEAEVVGGHKKDFVLWPIYLNQTTGIGTTNQKHFNAVLPLYSAERSAQRDSTTAIWPLFTYTDDRERKYREWDFPWPLFVIARGEGKTINRLGPLYSHAQNDSLHNDYALWPLWRNRRLTTSLMERERTTILFFLYSDITVKATGETNAFRKTDLWPLFTAQREKDGSERFQMLSVIEPLLPNKGVIRNYAPLWSVWRSEKNAKTGRSSQSFLWNTYRCETTRDSIKSSLLFGLFQYQSTPEGRRWRLFYLPAIQAKAKPVAPKRG